MAFLQPGRGKGPSFGEGRAFHVPRVVLWTIGALAAAHVARVALPTFLTYMFLQLDLSGLGVSCLSLLAFGSVASPSFFRTRLWPQARWWSDDVGPCPGRAGGGAGALQPVRPARAQNRPRHRFQRLKRGASGLSQKER